MGSNGKTYIDENDYKDKRSIFERQEWYSDGVLSGPVHPPRRPNNEARADHIRTLRDDELEAYCVPWELASWRGIRNHYAAMNQPELEFQATFDKDAARELRVRNGEQDR